MGSQVNYKYVSCHARSHEDRFIPVIRILNLKTSLAMELQFTDLSMRSGIAALGAAKQFYTQYIRRGEVPVAHYDYRILTLTN